MNKQAATSPRAVSKEPLGFGRRVVWVADNIVNIAVLIFFLLLILCGSYFLWASKQIYDAGDANTYTAYKPADNNSESFASLQSKNPDILGWLTVYGTHIDFPFAQAKDNNKYINTDAKGEFSLAGCPFLDYRNAADLSDFNSIIYGHHMEKEMMFGDLDRFLQQKYFDAHEYGEVYYGGKKHGVRFFAFLKADAYDNSVYRIQFTDGQSRQDYLDNLLQKAEYKRDGIASADDHMVLLSTCSSDSTNGRYLLAGIITDQMYKNTFAAEKSSMISGSNGAGGMLHRPIWMYGSCLLLLILIVVFIYEIRKRNRNSAGKHQGGGER